MQAIPFIGYWQSIFIRSNDRRVVSDPAAASVPAGRTTAGSERTAFARAYAACRMAYLRLQLRFHQNPSADAVEWAHRLAMQTLRDRFDPLQIPDVFFEINTDCNYRCPFCVQAYRPRAAQYATTEAFERVLAELQRLDFQGTLTLSVNNEPFLHPNLVDFCRRASKKLPQAKVCLTSNGSLIKREHLAALVEVPRPPAITVNDYTPGHEIIRRLQPWLAESRFARLPMTLQSRSRDEVLSNRAGNIPGGRVPGSRESLDTCMWPFVALWIGPALEVFQCCSDYDRSVIIGDLNRQGLMEIWNADSLRNLRTALLLPDRRRDPLCAKCDAQWWELPRHCRSEHR